MLLCHLPEVRVPKHVVQAHQLATAALACCQRTWQQGWRTSLGRLPSLASLASARQPQRPRPRLSQLKMKLPSLPRRQDAGRRPPLQSLALLTDLRKLVPASLPRRPSAGAKQLLLLTPLRRPCHQVSCAGAGQVCRLQTRLRGGIVARVLCAGQGAACTCMSVYRLLGVWPSRMPTDARQLHAGAPDAELQAGTGIFSAHGTAEGQPGSQDWEHDVDDATLVAAAEAAGDLPGAPANMTAGGRGSGKAGGRGRRGRGRGRASSRSRNAQQAPVSVQLRPWASAPWALLHLHLLIRPSVRLSCCWASWQGSDSQGGPFSALPLAPAHCRISPAPCPVSSLRKSQNPITLYLISGRLGRGRLRCRKKPVQAMLAAARTRWMLMWTTCSPGSSRSGRGENSLTATRSHAVRAAQLRAALAARIETQLWTVSSAMKDAAVQRLHPSQSIEQPWHLLNSVVHLCHGDSSQCQAIMGIMQTCSGHFSCWCQDTTAERAAQRARSLERVGKAVLMPPMPAMQRRRIRDSSHMGLFGLGKVGSPNFHWMEKKASQINLKMYDGAGRIITMAVTNLARYPRLT